MICMKDLLCCIFGGIRLSEPEATQLDAQIVNPNPSTPNPIQFSKFVAHHQLFLGRKMVVNRCNVEMKWSTPQKEPGLLHQSSCAMSSINIPFTKPKKTRFLSPKKKMRCISNEIDVNSPSTSFLLVFPPPCSTPPSCAGGRQ